MEHLLLSCIESRVESNRNLYSQFQLGPFDKGQGLTIANAMRRTLLSELSGFAIVCVEIPGVSHEYSNLKGVRESVLDLLLNLKQIVLISKNSYTAPEIGFLKVQGPAIITSSDLKLPEYLQCADPNQYIATLSDNGSLEMKFMICKGKSFIIQTSFELISQKFQLHFSNEQNKHSDISFPSNFTSKKPLFFTSDSNKGIIIPKKQNIAENKHHLQNPLTLQNKVENLKKNPRTNLFLDRFKENRLENFVNLCSKRRYVKTSHVTVKHKTQKLYENFLDKKFFKKVEKNLLYSTLNISQFQSFRNLVYNQNLKKNSLTNILLVDAVFMPVLKVNFNIQNINKFYKVKNRTLINQFQRKIVQEKIFLEISTNGSIYPKNAIYIATKHIVDLFVPLQKTCLSRKHQTFILDKNYVKFSRTSNINLKKLLCSYKINQFFNFQNLSLNKKLSFIKNQNPSDLSLVKSGDSKTVSTNKKNLVKQKSLPFIINFEQSSFDIIYLNFSNKLYICLKRAGIHTIQDLIRYPKNDLLKIKGFGKESLQQINFALTKFKYQKALLRV